MLFESLERLVTARYRRRLGLLRTGQAEAEARFIARYMEALRGTAFGRSHEFAKVRTPGDFARAVPVRAYDEFLPWIERTLDGAPDVLVPGRPRYYGVTTGTTGGEKRIPVTERLTDAAKAGFLTLLTAALDDVRRAHPHAPSVIGGKLLVLGATMPLRPERDGVLAGTMSTIAIRERPWWLHRKIVPGNELDELPTWEEKLEALAKLTSRLDVRVVAGMPPWLLALFERLVASHGGAAIRTIWPKLALLLHAGTFMRPYRDRLAHHVIAAIPFRNMYSATEAVFAIQDTNDEGLLPLVDEVFIELIPVESDDATSPPRIPVSQAEVGVEYAVVCTSWTGLAACRMGDTVRVVSRNPVRVVVTGRTRQRASIAGEKVTIDEIEQSLIDVAGELGFSFAEFVVVPEGPDAASDGRPRHHWFIEFRATVPLDVVRRIAAALDRALASRSATYRVRREGSTPALGAPVVTRIPEGSFVAWLARSNRQGSQNKVPRIIEEVPDEFKLH
ncbi:MAG: GH3 auxin-responsive promoter family protein [Deltaproteobacteria bacterium]|nr:GH3 auxin-responsive promoter family protein [Deltaproteobacteria bacterium]